MYPNLCMGCGKWLFSNHPVAMAFDDDEIPF
jgi:hypothetical protein